MTVDLRSEVGSSGGDGLGPFQFLDTYAIVRYLTRDNEKMGDRVELREP